MGVFDLPQAEGRYDEASIMREALEHPIGTPRLRDLARPGQRVVIVTSDLTRPCPSQKLLPLVLTELAAAGVPERSVTVVVALGLHRPMTNAELETALGADVFQHVRIVNHDPADTTRLGVTTGGTPVEIFRLVVEADLRVCLGNLELHYFAGYSGGPKRSSPAVPLRPQ
jgi:nickel-dependent lactate racemase